MIYLNNAGTTWPKPTSVNEAMNRFHELSPAQWVQLFERGLKQSPISLASKIQITSFFRHPQKNGVHQFFIKFIAGLLGGKIEN